VLFCPVRAEATDRLTFHWISSAKCQKNVAYKSTMYWNMAEDTSLALRWWWWWWWGWCSDHYHNHHGNSHCTCMKLCRHLQSRRNLLPTTMVSCIKPCTARIWDHGFKSYSTDRCMFLPFKCLFHPGQVKALQRACLILRNPTKFLYRSIKLVNGMPWVAPACKCHWMEWNRQFVHVNLLNVVWTSWSGRTELFFTNERGRGRYPEVWLTKRP
jgi:hypothetical protein